MANRLLSSLLFLGLVSFTAELFVRWQAKREAMTPEEERKKALEEVERILEPTAIVYSRIQQQFVDTISRAWSNEAYKGETFSPRKLSELHGSDDGKWS